MRAEVGRTGRSTDEGNGNQNRAYEKIIYFQ